MHRLNTTPPVRQDLRQLLAGNGIDRLLLGIGIAIIAGLWLWLHQTRVAGPPMVMIYHGKKLLAEYPIPTKGKPIHVLAKGDIGISDIVINTHGVHFQSSPCTGKQCILAGTRHNPGDVIACVPNRIMVSIQNGGAPENSYDGTVE